MEKQNYDVEIKIEKNLYVTDAPSKVEAIKKAIAFIEELLFHGIKPYSKITATKTNNTETSTEVKIIEPLLVEQIAEVDKIYNDLINVYNKDEIILLVENLNSYIGSV